MSLLEHAPRLDPAGAARLGRERYGLDASASPIPSERDQNFILETRTGDRYVLKVANASEQRAMLEAQNAAMTHAAAQVSFCPRVLPAADGETIARSADGAHFVRLLTYLPGSPLAKAVNRPASLLENVGRAVGRLDRALADFDHPAIHRAFHWDLASAPAVIDEYLPLVEPEADRRLVEQVSRDALQLVERAHATFRRSAVHHDANDWNVLVDGDRVTGIIDFGDMVHGWTVSDPAVAAAYAMLDAPDPLASLVAVARGYHAEHPLRHEEVHALLPLASLRLCMSVCIAAWQQRQRPGDRYLTVSQEPIRRTLPVIARIRPATVNEALTAAGMARPGS